MMTKDEATKWAEKICQEGTGSIRQEYLERFDVGEAAKKVWDDSVFTYGIEYGILMAIAKIFGDL